MDEETTPVVADEQSSVPATPSAAESTGETQPTPQGADESVAVTETDDDVEWLKKKGVDPTDPEALKKAAKIARDNQREFHQSRQTQLKDQAVANAQDEYIDPVMIQLQQMQVRMNVSDFYASHPEAKELDGELAEVVKARPYLAQDLDAAYALVKAGKTDAEIKAAEARGRERAKAELAKSSTAGTPTSNASGAAPESKNFSDLSIKEMEAKLGFVRR
jgi:hypothetical protein